MKSALRADRLAIPEQPSLTGDFVKDRLPVLRRFRIGDLVSNMRTRARDAVQGAPAMAAEGKGIQSPADVMQEVVEQTQEGIRSLTFDVLAVSKPWWSQKSRRAIADAVVDGDFGDLGNDTPRLKMAAVALRMIVERTRSCEGFSRLQSLGGEALNGFGMSQEMGRLLVGKKGERRGFLWKLRAADMEYLRQYGRALHGENLRQWSHDAVRPRRRLFNVFHDFANAVEGGEEIPEFADAKTRNHFAECMRMIAKGYRTHMVDQRHRSEPVSWTVQWQAVERANAELNRFYHEHPDFPLTIIPPGFEYLRDEFGKGMGHDAEVMVAWRDCRDAQQEETIRQHRTPLAEALLTMFPDELKSMHLRDLRRAMVYVRSDLMSFGVGRTTRSFAEEFGKNGVLLLKNIQEQEETKPSRRILKSLLPTRYHRVVDSPHFSELVRMFTVLHELIHRVFPSEGKAAKALGETEAGEIMDDELAEGKSDSVAMAVYLGLYGDRAKALFGEQARLAVNLALMGATMNTLDWSNAQGETSPYWISAVHALHAFSEAGLLMRNSRSGNVMIDAERLLNVDVSDVMESIAKRTLGLYRAAHDGDAASVARAREHGQRLSRIKPRKIVKALKSQLSRLEAS